MSDNPLKRLAALGQSVWYDFIRRDLYQSGRARRRLIARGRAARDDVEPDDLPEGDRRLRPLRRRHPPARRPRARTPAQIFEALAVRDVSARGRRLPSGVRARRGGDDGFVSIEVQPAPRARHAGHDRRGATALDGLRPPERDGQDPRNRGRRSRRSGQCLAEGININITLLFSVDALPRGHGGAISPRMEERVVAGPAGRQDPLGRELLRQPRGHQRRQEARRPRRRSGDAAKRRAPAPARQARDRQRAARLRGLRGDRSAAPRFAALQGQGRRGCSGRSGRRPRPRIRRYPDLYYVEALVAPDTVDTMPPETVRRVPRSRQTRRCGSATTCAGARAAFRGLAELGIDTTAIFRRARGRRRQEVRRLVRRAAEGGRREGEGGEGRVRRRPRGSARSRDEPGGLGGASRGGAARADAGGGRGRLRPPCTLVIFGASGDLTRRLLAPAIAHLSRDGAISPDFAIVGIARSPMHGPGVSELSRRRRARAHAADAGASGGAARVRAVPLGRLRRPRAVRATRRPRSTQIESRPGRPHNRIFYLATPPETDPDDRRAPRRSGAGGGRTRAGRASSSRSRSAATSRRARS